MTSRTKIKALGEIAIRVKNINRMKQFYNEVLGLEVLKELPNWVFFGIEKEREGHPRFLVLVKETVDVPIFERKPTIAATTPLHHFAFEILLDDYWLEKERLEKLGYDLVTTTHGWGHLRSIYLQDPEENVVELVAYDASVS